jgi:hypothetical protein
MQVRFRAKIVILWPWATHDAVDLRHDPRGETARDRRTMRQKRAIKCFGRDWLASRGPPESLSRRRPAGMDRCNRIFDSSV